MTLRRHEEMSFAELVHALSEIEHIEGEIDLERTMERRAMDRRLMMLLSKGTGGEERRGAVRVAIPLKVKLFTDGGEMAATLVDLGEGGVQVLASGALPTDALLEVELVAEPPAQADRFPPRARARVSWSRPQADGVGVGLQFVSQPEGHRRRMRRLVLEILRRMPVEPA